MSQAWKSRRRVLMERCAHGLTLVRGAAASGANPNFFYLTGLEEPRGALLLAPQGVRIGSGREYVGPDYVRGRMAQQVLFLPESDPVAASWGEDSAATAGSVSQDEAGVDAVIAAARLDGILGAALQREGVLHYVRSAAPTLAGAADVDGAFVERVRRRFFALEVRDATPVVHEMRQSKDEGEVQAIQAAAKITAEALAAAVAALRTGMLESDIEGRINQVYRAHGATDAFGTIVACGGNAVLPHYRANSAPIEPGKLLLIDTGAHLNGYGADVTRTYPVDGKFDPRQREVYGAVLAAQERAIELCRPGALLADIHAAAWESIDRAGFGPEFIHGTSHHLGIETHDAGDVHRPLAAGAVITVEPGIYLADEAIGVRIEDDVLVTDDGPRVLTASIAKSVEDVERQMA